MSTSHILSLLLHERDRLQAAINALKDSPEPGAPGWVAAKKGAPQLPPKVAAAHKSHSERMKENWRKRKAAQAESAAPKKKTAKAIIAEAIAPKEDEEFKSRMSAAMKASWAKRRKKATKTKG